jgi:hypothetical protein
MRSKIKRKEMVAGTLRKQRELVVDGLARKA